VNIGGVFVAPEKIMTQYLKNPLPLPHFPSPLHAFVWRNWTVAPLERLAKVVRTDVESIRRVGTAMGLPEPPAISADQWRRSYITVIRRNWHLLPEEQLLVLLDWDAERLAYILQEDDFLSHKLGAKSPCPPIRYAESTPDVSAREKAIAAVLKQEFPAGAGAWEEPPFAFVKELSSPMKDSPMRSSAQSPRFCYSYFALYGDPLLETETDSYPEGYLARMAAAGVNGVWLQAVLYKLTRFPWQPSLSEHWQERLENLAALAERAAKYGIGVYLYLNEPRSMPLAFFEKHSELKGVVEGDRAALCSGHPDVQRYLTDSVAEICTAVPALAGIFTITASENLTNCWSHHRRGNACPRCGQRRAADVIAEVNCRIAEGIKKSGSATRFIVWDWGWAGNDPIGGAEVVEEVLKQLPRGTGFMAVSEWDLPIERGGVKARIGEYSISAVGPSDRAKTRWALARQCGLQPFAKIQAGNTWELSPVPYIPALACVAQHAANLREQQIDGLMLGWTLGGYPSPNLEVVAEIENSRSLTPKEAMLRVAQRRYGEAAATVVEAWETFSAAFSEFPFHIDVAYVAPQHYGPSNLLWEHPTGCAATMIGFPYDDLKRWAAIYPPEVFIQQFDKMADGFERGLETLRSVLSKTAGEQRRALELHLNVAEASAIHFRTTANQARFVLARDALSTAPASAKRELIAGIEAILRSEIELAKRLAAIQARDSRIGFEASNHYYYLPIDLAEKVVNCRDLLERWLPSVH
jgi:hypothetical protein